MDMYCSLKFSTSCVSKTFGVVMAKDSSGTCVKQCAKWKGELSSGFEDGSIDVEFLGIDCDEMQANVKPIISDTCPQHLRHN